MLSDLIDLLEERYGKPGKSAVGGPLEMILWENVAYLVNDERRKQTYEKLKTKIGISPQKVLAASLDQLRKVLEGGGIIRDERVKKLSTIMQIAMREFSGDLNQILDFPIEKAKKALQLFPGIAEPGAEKILLFCRRLPVLALESNGLRVLLRIGYGTEQSSYSASYKSVRRAILPEIHEDYDWLIRAHQLLRIHGQQLCKRSTPQCRECPLIEFCKYGRDRRL
jgi:endonuclease III